jgi:hypothetical protein
MLFILTWTILAILSVTKGEFICAIGFGFAAVAACLIFRHDQYMLRIWRRNPYRRYD